MRVGIHAEHGRILFHEGLALGVDEAGTQGNELGLALPAEVAGHVPHAAELEVLESRAGVPYHFHAFARGGVLAVGGLPAAHARGRNDHLRTEAVEVAAYGVKAHGAHDTAVLLEKVGHHDAAETRHVGLAQLLDEVAHHVFAAAAHKLCGIQLHMGKAALGNALERAVFLAEELAAVALIVFQTLMGATENFLDLFLIAESVEVVDEIFQPGVQVVARKHGVEVAAGHGHEAAPFLGALVHDDDLLFGQKLGEALCRPQTGGAAADDEKVAFHDMGVSVRHGRPPCP